MKTITLPLPLTHEELLDRSGGALMRFPATEAQYWELLEKAEFRADYHQQQIVAMSYENNLHSLLVASLIILLDRFFSYDEFAIHNSNRPVYTEECGSVFNPDGSVVAKPSQLYEYRPGMNAERTPVLLIEVLSPTTQAYDLAEKLPCYKKIPSLRQIIYLRSDRPFVTVYDRIDDSDRWLNVDYDQLDQSFDVNDQPLALEAIYQRVEWPESDADPGSPPEPPQA